MGLPKCLASHTKTIYFFVVLVVFPVFFLSFFFLVYVVFRVRVRESKFCGYPAIVDTSIRPQRGFPYEMEPAEPECVFAANCTKYSIHM